MHGDDAAGGDHVPDAAQAAAPHHRGQLGRRVGSAAPSWADSCRPRRPGQPAQGGHQPVEPQLEEGGQRRPVGVVISSTTTRPPGRTTRAISLMPRARSENSALRSPPWRRRTRHPPREARGRWPVRSAARRRRPGPRPGRSPWRGRARACASEKSAPTTVPPGCRSAQSQFEGRGPRCRWRYRAPRSPGAQPRSGRRPGCAS